MITRGVAAACLLMLASVGWGQTVTAPAAAIAPEKSPRIVVPLSGEAKDWSFHKGTLQAAAATGDKADGQWESVAVPHCWNAQDGQDGGNDYYKGDGWYRRTVDVGPELKGKELYLRFEGVNRDADVYVNGQLAGRHEGGTQTFVFDVTKLVHEGANVLAVKANNAERTFAPLSADFTFWGGIYRPVQLVAVEPVHISLTDYGSPGIYITTPEVSEKEARVHIRAQIRNDGDSSSGYVISANAVAAGAPAPPRMSDITNMSADSGVKIDPGKTAEFEGDLKIPNPHRWNGRADPYLYSLYFEVMSIDHNKRVHTSDIEVIPFGIRTYSIDPEKGFILNGKPYDLHGVNRHQDRIDKGWAISEADHREDMALIKEMGCTAIRLAHYQHAQYFYDLCDKEGMVVWAEIPVVNTLRNGGNGAPTDEFVKNARQQYTELIRQCYNHPSICFWSSGNEVDPPGNNPQTVAGNNPVYEFFRNQRELGHQEDPTRPAVAAWRERFFPPADVTDYFGLNEYLGWYTAADLYAPLDNNPLERYIQQHSQNGVKGRWAVTEYGAGASIYFHSENPQRMDHTEEYQAMVHEATWPILSEHKEIWGKFLWSMFDFGADDRFEGDTPGRNDKGLVTYDRKTRKDAFYFYKANWSGEPVIHLNSKRFTVRGLDHIPVVAYTNAAWVTLTVNGKEIGGLQNEDCIVRWVAVYLNEGENQVKISANFPNGQTLSDTAVWTYKPGAPSEVYEAQTDAMKKALEGGPPRVNFPPKPW